MHTSWMAVPCARVQAAQALEPAALVALGLLGGVGACTLVGDPQQLPATVLSRAAEAGHLTQSLFERLQRVGWDPLPASTCRRGVYVGVEGKEDLQLPGKCSACA